MTASAAAASVPPRNRGMNSERTMSTLIAFIAEMPAAAGGDPAADPLITQCLDVAPEFFERLVTVFDCTGADARPLAPGQQADIAVFNLDQPRHFGMHDPMIAPVTCAGSASVRYLLIGGRIVVENGAIPGMDIQKLRSDAARVVAHLAA